MSISDRLDQIERQSEEASEQWGCGRSAFNADNHAPPIDVALANGGLMLAALRAVLAIDTGDNRNVYGLDFEAGMVKALWIVHRTIATALGEDRHVDQ